jgi:hypothetical protein
MLSPFVIPQQKVTIMHLNMRQSAKALMLSALLLCVLAACTPGVETSEAQEQKQQQERQQGKDETGAETKDMDNVSGDPVLTSQRYFDLLAAGEFEQAYVMWAPNTPTGEGGSDLFERSMLAYQSFDGKTMGDARTEGAAGTLYAKVPVQVSGLRRGESFSRGGTMELARCNDVPGCSDDERRWKIRAINLEEE